MRFIALLVLRDEADILRETLDHISSWADVIYVYDLGSIDGSWNIIEEYARRDRRVVPWRQRSTIYDVNLRTDLFEYYRQAFQDGDWIVCVDADEFYDISPPTFVREHLAPHESMVYLSWYYFRLTSAEVDEYESGRRLIFDDRKLPIRMRRKFYKIPNYSEPRMFRYRSTMKWPNRDASFPYHAGFVARRTIPIRHYPHRDPAQMEARFDLRSAMKALGSNAGPHWKATDWRADVLQLDRATGKFLESTEACGLAAAPGHTHGPVCEWDGASPLPHILDMGTQLGRWSKRLVQRTMYATGVRLLDRLHPGHSGAFERKEIPANFEEELKRRRLATLQRYRLED